VKVDEMVAGLELDRLVSEKVLGLPSGAVVLYYSEKLTEAFQVQHHRGWLYSLHSWGSIGMKCIIYANHPEMQDTRAEGPTLEVAICKAALKMVGCK
jgi:hypothetical protein